MRIQQNAYCLTKPRQCLVDSLGRKTWLPVTLAIASLIASSAGSAQAGDYALTIVAQPGDTIGGKTLTGVGAPSINNRGVVAFPASFSGSVGIFTQSALVVQTGDTIGGKTLADIGGAPSINDLGDVAFLGFFTDGTYRLILAVPSGPR